MTDPIADMLIRIRNAQAVRHETVDIPYSKIKYQISNILLQEYLIEKIERKFRKAKKTLRLTLKYQNKEPVISGARRISKPSKRVYLPSKKLRSPRGGSGVSIISTPKGLMTKKEARKQRVGGEIICEVW